MNCERCGQANPGASWYCSRCGAPLDDLNVADSGLRRPLPRLLKWSLAVTAISLLVVVGVTLFSFGRDGARRLADERQLVERQDIPGESVQGESVQGESVQGDSVQGDSVQGESVQGESVQGESVQGESVQGDSVQGDSAPAPANGHRAAVAATAGTGSLEPQHQPWATTAPSRSTAAAQPKTAVPATPTAVPAVRSGAPVWAVPRLSEPPRMDGKLGEWAGEPVAVEAVVFGSEFWDGPADLSATAFSGWDDDALYFAVQVVDEYFSQPSRGRQLHLSDSIELQLDVDLAGDMDSDEYSGDDWQIGVSPGDFAGRPPNVYVWRPLAESIKAIRTGAQRLDNGYIVEFTVPWSLLGFDPARTKSMGMALNVSDNDDPRPAQLTMISFAPERSWSDPRTFATLVLVD